MRRCSLVASVPACRLQRAALPPMLRHIAPRQQQRLRQQLPQPHGLSLPLPADKCRAKPTRGDTAPPPATRRSAVLASSPCSAREKILHELLERSSQAPKCNEHGNEWGSAVQTTVKSHCSLNILRAADLGNTKVCQAPWGPMKGLPTVFGLTQTRRTREIARPGASAGGARGEGERRQNAPSAFDRIGRSIR